MSLPLLGSGPGAGGASSGDPSLSSVKLLMGFEGSNGSTGSPGMTDESGAAHGNATVNSGSTISTAQFKFGASSLRVIANSSIEFGDSADWNFGAGNFTIEMFIRPVNLEPSPMVLVNQWGGASNNSWVLYITNGTNKLSWNWSSSGTSALGPILASGSISAGVWTHVCMDYDGSKYRMYQDGAMVGSNSTPVTLFDSSVALAIGNFSGTPTAGFGYDGYYDELRITKGVARYASDSGFTVPTAAYPRS